MNTAWLAGVLLAGLVGGTVLLTDNSAAVTLQGIQWKWLSAVMCIVLPVWLVGYVITPQFTVRISCEVAYWVLMGFGAALAIHGLCQIAGICPSRHSLFVLTGTFYNPGPYSGYLSAIFPIALYKCLATSRSKDLMSKLQNYFSIFVMMSIGCVLPAGMSRAAWVACAISCGYVFFRMYRVKVTLFLSKYKYALLAIALLGALCATGIYLMKRESADGRLLIWKITSQVIAENPGGEKEGRSFSALYGDAQERYFSDGEYSDSEAWVAGTPDFAFNEYLQIAVEHGVPVAATFIVILLVLLLIAGSRNHLTGIGGCMVSLMVFACFSYPLHIPAIVSIWLIVAMVLTGEGLVKAKRQVIAKMVLLPIVLMGFLISLHVHELWSDKTDYVRQWGPVRVLYTSGAFKDAAEEYGKLYSNMDWNEDFCFEYGRILYNVKRYDEAEDVLLKAMKLSGDPMILNILGRNAHDMGDYEKSERYLVRSTLRLPKRIYPHYLLVKLYATPEYYNKGKLLNEAEIVLNCQPKVESSAIMEMRHKVKEILTKNGLQYGKLRAKAEI